MGRGRQQDFTGYIYPNVAAWLQAHNMPRIQLARLLYTDTGAVRRLMTGETELTLREAIRIKTALGYPGPVERLFRRNDA